AADARLRPALRRGERSVDDGQVHRGRVQVAPARGRNEATAMRSTGKQPPRSQRTQRKFFSVLSVLSVLSAVAFSALSALSASSQPPQAAQAAARASAPIDLTGYWVSIVTEDWRYRMMTPRKGDYASVPLNAAARKAADAWDPAADAASGNACRSYGVGNIMRVAGRVHITWQDDETLKIESDAGTQTRLLHFAEAAQPPAGDGGWQGFSVARWQLAGPQRRGGPAAGGGRGGAPKSGRAGGVPLAVQGGVPGHKGRRGPAKASAAPHVGA